MANDLPRHLRRLVRARVVTQQQLRDPKLLRMLKRLSAEEATALISLRRKFRGKVQYARRARRGAPICLMPL